jgi:hypothetical protein
MEKNHQHIYGPFHLAHLIPVEARTFIRLDAGMTNLFVKPDAAQLVQGSATSQQTRQYPWTV